jgi:queuine tRNA-ribosyltransferase
MLTDSGGFQIFSLGHGLIADEIKGRGARKNGKTLSAITEEGATFRSYVDGRMHTLTPEGAITIQRKLGADLILVLDECTPYHADRAYTENSLRLSQRWADRCLTEFQHEDTGQQALYGIIQGGVYPDLRADAAKNLAERPFFGQAVGGSLGGTSAQMDEVVGYAMNHAHRERPTHLLGIGGIRDIWVNVAQGIDSFDCVHPTRLARHGGALYPNKRERLNLRNARYANDDRPLQEGCACPTCRDHSRAYLHHLTRTGEPLGFLLLVQHNIFFMNRLMREIRAALHEGRFHAAQRAALTQLQSDDDSA